MPNTPHPFSLGRSYKHGFTLVELMIVIAIIGLLAVALLPKLTGAQANARDVARKKDLQTIAAALEQVYDERGRYPLMYHNTSEWLRIPWTATGCISTASGISASFLMEKLDGGKVPLDPSGQRNGVCGLQQDWLDLSTLKGTYMYYGILPFGIEPNPNTQGYSLQASMENYHNANAFCGNDCFWGRSFLGTYQIRTYDGAWILTESIGLI